MLQVTLLPFLIDLDHPCSMFFWVDSIGILGTRPLKIKIIRGYMEQEITLLCSHKKL